MFASLLSNAISSFVQRTFDWGGGNIFVWRGWCKAVFFNFFAATEPSANFCVAHGTLCDCETVVLIQSHRTVVENFIPGYLCLFRMNPWQPIAEPWLKNTVVWTGAQLPPK